MAKAKSTEPKKSLCRSETNKVIAGVCAGMAEFFDLDPVIVRLIFVSVTLLGGSGVFLYLILWIVIPSESQIGKQSDEYVKDNLEEIKMKAKSVSSGKDRNILAGIILLVLGTSFLLNNFGIVSPVLVSKLWPIVLIIVGVILLGKNGGK